MEGARLCCQAPPAEVNERPTPRQELVQKVDGNPQEPKRLFLATSPPPVSLWPRLSCADSLSVFPYGCIRLFFRVSGRIAGGGELSGSLALDGWLKDDRRQGLTRPGQGWPVTSELEPLAEYGDLPE